jgi:copper chaperone
MREPNMSEDSFRIKVKGMTCQHCVAAVDKSVRAVAGVTDVDVNLEAGIVVVDGHFDPTHVIEAIRAAGYDTD